MTRAPRLADNALPTTARPHVRSLRDLHGGAARGVACLPRTARDDTAFAAHALSGLASDLARHPVRAAEQYAVHAAGTPVRRGRGGDVGIPAGAGTRCTR